MPVASEDLVTRKLSAHRRLGQGLEIWQKDPYPDVDILAVPGLGTNPKECWTWKANEKEQEKRSKASDATESANLLDRDQQATGPVRQFNWITDPEGLASLFPKARIMLYDYASAWRGGNKVTATMRSLCTWLLDDLKEKRKEATEITRPLIMIGHSMGGVVITKTLCMARARREFEAIVTCTIGCVFFGAPFKGTNMAKIALFHNQVFGHEAYESLLQFMKTERNDALDEVTDEFLDINRKHLDPPIDILCVWEQIGTDVAYSERLMQKLPGLLQHNAFKASARAVVGLGAMTFKLGAHFVEKDSAVLKGYHNVGLTADHRNLVKFESITSEKFLPVKVAMSNMYRTAKMNVRKRTFLSGQNLLTSKTVNQVRRSLEGVDMGLKFRSKERERSISSWLTSEPVYKEWLTSSATSDQHRPCLWLKGGPGLGKTNGSLAAIQGLSHGSSIDQQTESLPGQGASFLAYFLCESTSGCCTAEDILKSLITQIINQDESLAQHGARWFVPNPRYRGPSYNGSNRMNEDMGTSGAKATATVDNLWKCLQDMIDDPVVNNIHLIINNIHILESMGSTPALLSKLRDHALSLDNQPVAARRVKWLITSRNDRHIREYLSADSIGVIDLENDLEYGAKVKQARQKYAKDAVAHLRSSQNYTTDLAYYVRNSIESQSEDETWIDILCILLRAMPSNTNNLAIRKWLKEVGSYNIHKLIDHAWDTVLSRNEDMKNEIEELFQALTITYEAPTLADLAVLTQIDDPQLLTELVRKCSPILLIGDSGEHQGRVIFANPEFGGRLSDTCHGHSDQSSQQRKRFHGVMALRCFNYIKTWYKITKTPGRFANLAASLVRPAPSNRRLTDGDDLIDLDDDFEDEEMDTPLAADPDCSYPIKHLFRHLSEGFPDVAQELFEDDPDFWGQTSRLRDAWLKDFQALTSDLKDLNTNGVSALHVAAGIGANELVSILVARNGPPALSWTSDEGMTALHVAAFNNHPGVVEALLRTGADIEAGEGTAGTALHLAALRGNTSILALLISKGANVNASSESIGPVINAAIRSGTVDAVKQIMDGDVRFDLDYTKCDAPLSLSARMSEPALFQDILETGRDKWLQNVKLLDQALIAASYSGRLESVRILLRFPHVYTNDTLERAILSAALEKKWSSVIEILDHAMEDSANGTRRAFKLDDAFYLAATSREDRIDVLEKIWAFTNNAIAEDIRDFSLYQATVLRKDATVIWLLDTCQANADATTEKPASMTSEITAAASTADFCTPLNAAASTGNIVLVNSLLSKGAEIDDNRSYALQLAASEGHTEVVQILLNHGALVDRQATDNEELGFFSSTALQAACDNNRVGVVEALIKHGANPNLGGGPLSNPITAATQMVEPDILRLLLDAPGINVNVIGGEDKSTPLINAATFMSTGAVELLVRNGADVNAQNDVGDTALIMAASRGDKACVDLLCDNDADVTYRSPQRGLAIQVAAKGLHPLCAHTLAERMGGTIDDYREKGLSDLVATRKRLNDAMTELKARDSIIDTLNSLLAEKEEQLEVANQDVDFHKLEKERLVSVHSSQGETYLSSQQRMKAIQNERIEQDKQLDAYKGQVEMGNVTIKRLQDLYEEEKGKNADLRRRHGYAVLQEEKKAAEELAEQHKNDAFEQARLEEQQRAELQQEIRMLRDESYGLKEELQSVRMDEEAANVKSHAERLEKEQAQSEVAELQARVRELEETLSTVQAAATRKEAVASGPQSPSGNAPEMPQKDDYFLQRSVTGDNILGINGSGESPSFGARVSSRMATQSPNGSPFASPGEMGSGPASPRNRPNSPYINGRSASGRSDGFWTVHGQHRADGSLGGYRKDRMVRRGTSDSLYDSSIKDGVGGKTSMSSDSLHSSDGVKAGSAKAG